MTVNIFETFIRCHFLKHVVTSVLENVSCKHLRENIIADMYENYNY